MLFLLFLRSSAVIIFKHCHQVGRSGLPLLFLLHPKISMFLIYNLSQFEICIVPYRLNTYVSKQDTVMCGIAYPITKTWYSNACIRYRDLYSCMWFASKVKLITSNTNAVNCQILKRYYYKLYIFLLSMKRWFVWS